jgi:hypothetical protein
VTALGIRQYSRVVDRSGHFLAMLVERGIEEKWVERAVSAPDIAG